VIGSTRALRVFAYAAPADLRKGFDGLAALVVSALGRDPLSGECFLFTSRLRTRANLLHYDGTGFCLYHKWLEAGRFASLWERATGESVELTISSPPAIPPRPRTARSPTRAPSPCPAISPPPDPVPIAPHSLHETASHAQTG
jgi:transposase